MQLKGKRDAIMVFEALTAAERQSAAVRAYLAAYKLLEAGDAAAPEAFAAAAAEHPDDPLIRFHHQRLQQGETGILVVMQEK